MDAVFFADLKFVGDSLPAGGFAPAAFVESEFGINKVAVILQEPVHAVVRPAALFIRGESHDDVAVGLEALILVLDQGGDPDGRLSLVVASAAAGRTAIELHEL